jgi:transposase-like protein
MRSVAARLVPIFPKGGTMRHTYVAQGVVVIRPQCPACGHQMWITRIEPDKPDYDKRTFECPECKNELTEIVKYTCPLGSVAEDRAEKAWAA